MKTHPFALRFHVSLVMAFICLRCLPAFGATAVLYDGGSGFLPSFPFWAYGEENDPDDDTTPFAQNSAVILDTSSNREISAGYSTRTDLAIARPLDRIDGFTLRVDVQLISEEHFTDDLPEKDRAGYSIIVLSNDLYGIELGFWENEIWAQEYILEDSSRRFVKAEGTDADPAAGQSRYDIWIRENTYRLFADGEFRLSGTLRKYADFGFPYNQANFIFFGDNTASALAVSATSRVAVSFHVPGDLDGDGNVSIGDAIIALRTLAELSPEELHPEWAMAGGDVDGDFRIGLAEAVYALRTSAEIRP